MPRPAASSDSTSLKLSLSAPALAMIRRSWAGCNLFRCSLKNSLSRLFTRFLLTAQPTFRLTVTPSLHSSSGPATSSTMKCGVFLPRCDRWIRKNSERLRMRRSRGNFLSCSASRAFRRSRDCKSHAPLSPSAFNYPAPAGRCHSGPESMPPPSADIARLERSFHGGFCSVGSIQSMNRTPSTSRGLTGPSTVSQTTRLVPIADRRHMGVQRDGETLHRVCRKSILPDFSEVLRIFPGSLP